MFNITSEEESLVFLQFTIGSDIYTIPVESVETTIFVPPISKIPNSPIHIEGAINYRGKILRVINLGTWLFNRWHPLTKTSRIVILDLQDADNNVKLGILVDKVEDVIHLQDEQVYPVPAFLRKIPSLQYIQNFFLVNDKILLEIGIDSLVASSNIKKK